jgi:hypothetical protein
MNRGTVLTGLLVITFLLAGVLGAAYSGTMMAHNMDGMAGCPLMGNSAVICNMNPLEHLAGWQNLFAAVPVQSAVISLLIILALLFVARIMTHLHLWLWYPSPQAAVVAHNPEVSSHDQLSRFIARGLMHPKLF